MTTITVFLAYKLSFVIIKYCILTTRSLWAATFWSKSAT